MTPHHHHRRCSKSQMCFFKILHIISVLPPARNNKAIDIDLNITEAEPLDAVTTENSNSEISHVEEDQTSGTDHRDDEGYLGLLIEAAQMILGEHSEPEIKPAVRGGGKRKQLQCMTAATEAEWYAEFEDTSPVVRSKRGRNQVLPYRYRDSVVEPLVRWSGSTHRLTGNATEIVRSKRRTK